MSDKPVLGFIGLGIMGKPMVRNLIKAGYKVHVHSIAAADVDEAVTGGAMAQTSAQDVARNADVTITMVPDTPQVREVVLGPHGMKPALGRGKVVIDMSTISSLATK